MSDRPPLFDVLVLQRESWQRGARVLVESLLGTYPHLAEEREAVLDLVYNEHLLREEFGPTIAMAEYMRRFPQLAEDLRIQFEVDQALTVEDVGAAAQPSTTVLGSITNEEHELLPQLEGCDLYEELGKGAMGVVYRGWQRGARRPVAVKLLAPEVPAGRVRTEAEAASRLLHPNIVQVFEVKQLGDRTALVLEYVEGGNLAQKLANKPQPARDSARLVEVLAWAMAYAHGRGVVHRDLKPSNVLLSGKADAVLNQTVPKVGDFGLAKLLEGVGADLTRTHDVLGTPSYMAPEQTGISGAEVGPASDVYSLGAILYECLTGRPPFLGQNVLDTLEQVRHSEPVPPSRLQPRIPRDLEVICMTCLEKVPGRRFASARALAEDLRRFQNNEPIHARPTGIVKRTWKLARRRPVAASLLVAAVVAAVAVLVGGVVVNRALRTQRDLARQQAGDLDEQLTRARQLLYTTQLLRVGSVWESDPLQGLGMLEDPGACPPDLRCFSWRVLHAQCRRYREVAATSPNVSAVAFSSLGFYAWGERNGNVHVRGPELPDATLKQLTGQVNRIVTLVFSPDGKRLASGGADGRVVVWAVPGGSELARVEVPGRVGGMAWDPAGRLLAVNGGLAGVGAVRLIEVPGGRVRATFREETIVPCGVAVSPDGYTVCCAGPDHAIRLWDTRTGRQRGLLRGHGAAVSCLIFAASGRPLVSGSIDGNVRLWDPVRETELEQWTVATGAVRDLALDLRGQALAVAGEGVISAGQDGSAVAMQGSSRGEAVPDVQLWDLLTRQGAAPLRGHPGGALGVGFGADGRTLVTGGADGTVKWWDHPGRREHLALRGHSGKAQSVALSRDGRTVCWVRRGDRPGSGADEISVYDLDRSAPAGVVPLNARNVQCLALHPNGHLVAAGVGNPDEPAKVLIWEVRTRRLLQVLGGHAAPVVGVTFSADGRLLVSACRDGTVRLWDVSSGKLQWERAAGVAPLHGLALAAKAGFVGVSGGDASRPGRVVVWSLESGAVEREITTVSGPGCLALSEDGQLGAWIGGDGLVQVVGKTAEGQSFAPGMKSVAALAFSPDGKTLAVAGSGNGVKLWDVATLQERASLPGHRGGACFVEFGSDGRFVLTASVTQQARRWWGSGEVVPR